MFRDSIYDVIVNVLKIIFYPLHRSGGFLELSAS